jgi:hypothetical protein
MYSGVKCKTVTVQCKIVQHIAMKSSGEKLGVVELNAVELNAVQRSAVQWTTVQEQRSRTLEHNTEE